MSDQHPEISALIETAKSAPAAEAAAASARLADIGQPALGPVVEAVKQGAPSDALLDAVRRMGRPELVPALAAALKERDPHLSLAAAQALGRSGDERAVAPLLELFGDERAFYAARAHAALALAGLGAAGAVPSMLETLNKAARGKKDRQSASLIRHTSVALAMLGNREAAETALPLARHRDNDVREQGAKTLKHVVGRGLFPTLQKTLRGKSTDARQEALEAVFYLGLRESVEELVAYVERGDEGAPELVDDAVRRLRGLTGEDFKWDIKPSELRGWWKQHESQYGPNVCHRLGRPIDLTVFVELLTTEQAPERERLLTELHIITGEDFGLDPLGPAGEQAAVAARAQSWLRENAGSYERGAVYKYGHRQDLEHIFDPPAEKKSPGRRKSRSES